MLHCVTMVTTSQVAVDLVGVRESLNVMCLNTNQQTVVEDEETWLA